MKIVKKKLRFERNEMQMHNRAAFRAWRARHTASARLCLAKNY